MKIRPYSTGRGSYCIHPILSGL